MQIRGVSIIVAQALWIDTATLEHKRMVDHQGRTSLLFRKPPADGDPGLIQCAGRIIKSGLPGSSANQDNEIFLNGKSEPFLSYLDARKPSPYKLIATANLVCRRRHIVFQ